ncbi:MAG: histone deacetylase [Saprospiraceae bacterium]|nr:histone deacetylase [Saprospiraceae bacterium]
MLKIAFAPIYRYDLPPGHRFPMEKYEILPEQLLYEGTVRPDNFFEPQPIQAPVILLTHEAEYWEKLKSQTLTAKEIRAIGFPMTPRLVDRGRYIAAGTIECALYARQYGVALNIAGGTHHAFSYKGEGFCVFNDIAIAANYLLNKGLVQKILVVDLDVHQGNGTAQIFSEEPRVFTFSMHGEKNYPVRKERSDLDIGLPDGTEDAPYLRILRNTLPQLMDAVQPDLVFYLSGVDVLATDKLGRLSLSMAGCKERDRVVLETCQRNGIPVAVSMGGGYSQRLAQVIEAHANTYRLAQELFF